ncbi:MAG: tetratricopeptide repeat protein, partial [Acidobacteria bacterium]|nr:tetratricopeptide repeat protein [Candidatus Sulfomarinibacter sp. MAG AM2]
MYRNPWFTLALGLMVGLVFGYVLAERQPVPPGKALRLGAGAVAGQTEALPEGHPPVDDSSGAGAQRMRQQVSEIQGLLDANPEDAGLMAAMGNVYFDAGRWDEARGWYEKSLVVSAGDPDVMTDLAVVFRNLGQPQKSVELLDQVIAASPDHWQAWFNKVIVLNFDLHEHDAAAQALESLKELQKTNAAIPDLSGLEK